MKARHIRRYINRKQNKMVLKEYHGKVLPNNRDSFCYLFEVNVLGVLNKF